MKNRIKFCKFVKVASKVFIGILIALAILVVAALIFRACTTAKNDVAYASEADGIGVWEWNNDLSSITFELSYEVSGTSEYSFDFVCDSVNYVGVSFTASKTGALVYSLAGWDGGENSPYRTIDIKSPPPADFLTKLKANATYKGGTTAPQPGSELKPGKLNTMQQIIVQPNATDIWQEYTFDMHTFNGIDVWTDGKNIYLSLGTAHQYIYNEVTRQWETHTWTGTGWNIFGRYIWSDGSGQYLYHNNGATAYRYTIATETWEIVSNWSVSYDNEDRLFGQYFFTDGNGIYYWEPKKQICTVDITNRSVTATDWSRFDDFGAGYMWSDGINLYYNTVTDILGNPGESLQWVAGENNSAFKRIAWTMDGRTIEFSGLNVANIAGKMYVFLNGGIYQINPSSNTLNSTPAFEPNAGLSQISSQNSGDWLSYYIWSDGTRVYYSHYPAGLQFPDQLDPQNTYTQLELLPYETDATQIFLQFITADNKFANARTTFDGVNLTWANIKDSVNTLSHSNLFLLENWYLKSETGYTLLQDNTQITNGMILTAKYSIYADQANEFGNSFSESAYKSGYAEGEQIGIEIGKIQANDIVVENNASWRAGYAQGLSDGNENSLLGSPKAIFGSVLKILEIPLFGIDGFTVGAIVAIVVSLGVLLFILRIIRG